MGLALGDGNLSNPNGRAIRLRITCDARYPDLIRRISTSLQELLPANKVSLVGSSGNYLNVSVYSNRLEGLLGWTACGGSKQLQDVRVPDWVLEGRSTSVSCLRGLIETDGAVYTDRGYPMVIFSSVILGLAEQVEEMISRLGFRPRFYVIRPSSAKSVSTKYQVRLSRDVPAFMELVRPNKA